MNHWVVDALKRYDPALNVWRSKERKCWVIARLCDRQFIKKPSSWKQNQDGKWIEMLLPENSDRHISYRTGYAPIFFTKTLDLRVILHIWEMDSWRAGKRFAEKIDERDDKKEAIQDKKSSQELQHHSAEVYDYMQWKVGNRMPVNSAGSPLKKW